MKKKVIYFSLLLLAIFITSTAYFSYAFFTHKVEGHGKLNIVVGTLDYQLESKDLKDNQITIPANTTKEVVITITSLNSIDSKYELFYEGENKSTQLDIGYTSNTTDLPTGEIEANGKKKITIYIRNYSNQQQTITFGVEGGLKNNNLELSKGDHIPEISYYAENILNGAYPELKEKLVPVVIDNKGTVKKADLYGIWYQYEKKEWANAVILKEGEKEYQDNEVIPETSIESYFVWIPKYRYQLFNLENYTGLTEFQETTPPTIQIQFGLDDTTNTAGECTTPKEAGVIGSCNEGEYMTHPAFLAFGGKGFWVGKFETGYEGANTTKDAEVNLSSSDKIIIKPNVYSWRNITVGNAFQASYQYQEDLNSHMMKNTEWGAVAYLQHSKYGSATSVRINNNRNYITGYAATEEPTKGYNNGTDIDGNHISGTIPGKDEQYTVNYFSDDQENNQSASTTGNKTGVYDMSGGAWEYVMGYTTQAATPGGASGIQELYPGFFESDDWKKYYDSYESTTNTSYSNRILGDATGEMGPFGRKLDPDQTTRYKNSWYKDHAHFVSSSNPWFNRGGHWYHGSGSGVFAFGVSTGGVNSILSFRIVLTPTK